MQVKDVWEDAPCAHLPQARLRQKRAPAGASHADLYLQGGSMATHTLHPCMYTMCEGHEVVTMTWVVTTVQTTRASGMRKEPLLN